MRLLVFGLLIAALASPAFAGFDEGLAAYKRGDFKTALTEFQPLADQGLPLAQYALGQMYRAGQGVPQDYNEALKWYRLAADQGEVIAQYALGVSYYTQDFKESAKWYRLAADQGYAAAQYNLGKMYRAGQGVPQDYKQAVKWFQLAADQGHATAQYSLGSMYYNGEGIPRDMVASYAIFDIAAANSSANDKDAAKSRDQIVSKMTPLQLQAGEALSRQMMSRGLLKALDDYLSPPFVDATSDCKGDGVLEKQACTNPAPPMVSPSSVATQTESQ